MKERCDEILKQYGNLGCTDFSFPLKSEQPASVKPPTHPNPNVVRICKSVWNIGRSLTISLIKKKTLCPNWGHFMENVTEFGRIPRKLRHVKTWMLRTLSLSHTQKKATDGFCLHAGMHP